MDLEEGQCEITQQLTSAEGVSGEIATGNVWDDDANQTCDIFESIGLTSFYQYIMRNVACLQPLWFLTWDDFYSFEYVAHLFLSIFSILAMATIVALYICYFLLDDNNKPVLKPLKEIIPEGTFCSPTCTESHEHTRR